MLPEAIHNHPCRQVAGAVFGGCVQDFVILLFSVRRDGKSLTEMAREEIGRIGGIVAYVAIISIIVILLGVAALIVVNALKASGTDLNGTSWKPATVTLNEGGS